MLQAVLERWPTLHHKAAGGAAASAWYRLVHARLHDALGERQLRLGAKTKGCICVGTRSKWESSPSIEAITCGLWTTDQAQRHRSAVRRACLAERLVASIASVLVLTLFDLLLPVSPANLRHLVG